MNGLQWYLLNGITSAQWNYILGGKGSPSLSQSNFFLTVKKFYQNIYLWMLHSKWVAMLSRVSKWICPIQKNIWCISSFTFRIFDTLVFCIRNIWSRPVVFFASTLSLVHTTFQLSYQVCSLRCNNKEDAVLFSGVVLFRIQQ